MICCIDKKYKHYKMEETDSLSLLIVLRQSMLILLIVLIVVVVLEVVSAT